MEQGRTLLLSSGSELEESDSEYIEEETGESEETSSEDTEIDVEHHSLAFSGEQTERQRLLHSISDSEGNNDEEQTPDNVSRTQSVSRRRRHARAPRVLGRRSRERGRGGARPQPGRGGTRPRPVFQWREFNDDFFPVMPDLSVSPGITAEFPPVQHNCDYFMAFLSDAFLDHIVSESNTFHYPLYYHVNFFIIFHYNKLVEGNSSESHTRAYTQHLSERER